MTLVKVLLGPGGVVPHGLKTTALKRLVIQKEQRVTGSETPTDGAVSPSVSNSKAEGLSHCV